MIAAQRTVQNNILRSEALPAIEIEIDPEFQYIGSLRFILYDVAHVEQHHFIVADAEKRVIKRLWFQFEGFREDNNYTYDYSGMEALAMSGFAFLHNTYPMNVDQAVQERPTSDSAHVADFLKEKGYLFGGEILSHRLVWLDAQLRNELMIIYSESLQPTGYTLAKLSEAGPDAPEWLALARAFQERSLASFHIR